MNLLYVTTHLPPDIHFGGVVQVGQNYLTTFRHLLSNVTAYCVSKKPDAVSMLNPLHPICRKTILLHRWGFAPGLIRNLKQMMLSADIVAVNGILTYPVTIAGWMCKRMGKPYVVSLHGGLLPNALSTRAWRKLLFYRLFVRPILSGATAIHVTCDVEKECIENLNLKAPVTVIPNGTIVPPVDCEIEKDLPLQIKLLSRQRLVLFLSRIEPIKGLDLLIQVWADIVLKSKKKDITLVIAGPDERGYTQRLKAISERLGVEDKIIFMGMVEGNSKWALYKRADIFVLPSYSENFGLVVAESLSCGTPVITTTGTPWRDLELWNAGKWVAPERDTFGSALNELLEMSKKELQVMGERGKELVQEKYSCEIMAKKMITVYRNIREGKEIPLYPDPSEI